MRQIHFNTYKSRQNLISILVRIFEDKISYKTIIQIANLIATEHKRIEIHKELKYNFTQQRNFKLSQNVFYFSTRVDFLWLFYKFIFDDWISAIYQHKYGVDKDYDLCEDDPVFELSPLGHRLREHHVSTTTDCIITLDWIACSVVNSIELSSNVKWILNMQS